MRVVEKVGLGCLGVGGIRSQMPEELGQCVLYPMANAYHRKDTKDTRHTT